MSFEQLEPVSEEIFYHRNDPQDVRLGEIVPKTKYEEADVVIIGCPQDEGVRRNKGREGARLAPEAIRREFYKFTPFGIRVKIFDAGNVKIGKTLEETHETHKAAVAKILEDGKKIISLGGGNDISYPDGAAMAQVFGAENWLAVNVDAHFDVRADEVRNSGTPYRQLLEENLLRPDYFYEAAYQTQLASPVYFRYLQSKGVNLISLEQIRSREHADEELRELIKQKFINHSSSLNTFFGFDLDAVRASDAPGVSAPNPTGLRAGELITIVKFAATLTNTKMIEFTEVNPNFDIDNRTAKLVAVAMHRFCSNINRRG
jgi:Arginase/agmatinase/formimionoglutamate hydrolase, arginase family